MIRFQVHERLPLGGFSKELILYDHGCDYQHLPVKGDEVFLPLPLIEKAVKFLKGGDNELNFEVLGRQFFFGGNSDIVVIKVAETLESFNSRTGRRPGHL